MTRSSTLYLLAVLAGLQLGASFYVTVPTGFVGVPVVFGKVVAPLLMPGLSYYNPLSTRIEVVEVRPQSDAVQDIECITNEGLKLSFERIEIGNMLATESVVSTVERFGPLYDRFLVLDLVRHQVNVICSQKSFHQLAISEFEQLDDELRAFIQAENDRQKTGLQVLFVRLTKPKMPPSIENNYLALAEGTLADPTYLPTLTFVSLSFRRPTPAQRRRLSHLISLTSHLTNHPLSPLPSQLPPHSLPTPSPRKRENAQTGD